VPIPLRLVLAIANHYCSTRQRMLVQDEQLLVISIRCPVAVRPVVEYAIDALAVVDLPKKKQNIIDQHI
jgi:hypothetical protein